MTDFTTLKIQANSGTDASPVWNDVLFGTANYELRLCATGAGANNIASASWPVYQRPASAGVIPEMWAYVGSDNSGGIKVATYDGTSAHYMQIRISWDNTGTYAAAPVISAWKDSTLPAASAGTQPGTGDGSVFVNGSSDTSNTSYIKANFYGVGLTSGGVQQTPSGNAGGTLAATSGTAGAVSPGSAAWLTTWQSLQASLQYIQNASIPQAVTAGLWYGVFAFFIGPAATGGALVPVISYQYQWV